MISYVFPVCCLSPRYKRKQNKQNLCESTQIAQDLKTQLLSYKSFQSLAKSTTNLPPIEECHLPLNETNTIIPKILCRYISKSDNP